MTLAGTVRMAFRSLASGTSHERTLAAADPYIADFFVATLETVVVLASSAPFNGPRFTMTMSWC